MATLPKGRIALLSTALALAALLCVIAATRAHASATQESIFQDGARLEDADAATQAHALDLLKGLGVDTVHALVIWSHYAPSPDAAAKPSFNAGDPAAYPTGVFDKLDSLVKQATARGIGVILTPTSPIPSWASDCKGSIAKRFGKFQACLPNATAFEDFVTAVGKRYTGSFAGLPRVTRWSIWNEPNIRGWLAPQFAKSGKQVVFGAAIRYRALALAGISGLHAAGHGADQVMIAELAPIGVLKGNASSHAAAPEGFLREVFCLNGRGKAYHGTIAKTHGCKPAPRFAINAITHHPYTRGGSQPPDQKPAPGEITLAKIDRLYRVLGQAARARRIPAQLPVYFTEYGFQTDPPDTIFGLPLDKQSLYLNESDYVAWLDPRIHGVGQYLINDDGALGGFQTGLQFADGTPKPSLAAYKLPIFVISSGGKITVFGQVRPGGEGETLQIQNDAGGAFQPVQAVQTGPRGYFNVAVPDLSGQWRLAWTTAAGQTFYSREAAPVPPPTFGRTPAG
ncbi:MAG TPA: alpha-amylase family protein [Solirubrobacteraceae bacterium]|nr:alpha-amylase family protein [Solirubrobacteraceae bacterium]